MKAYVVVLRDFGPRSIEYAVYAYSTSDAIRSAEDATGMQATGVWLDFSYDNSLDRI